MSWSASQYSTFEQERTRPVRDLLNAVDSPDVKRAVDLGCGPGNSTEVLAARYPTAEICGIDSSADMVEAARARLPGLRFDQSAIEAWDDERDFDVILANAVMQWVPNHGTLLPRLAGRLARGGSLAIQMPDNLEEPAHRLMRQVAAAGPWATKLGGAAGLRTPRLAADWYYGLLRPHTSRVDVWRTTYNHVLDGTDAVIAWFKGSGLRPYLQPLTEPEQATFLVQYRAGLAEAYPPLTDGTVLLPFPRLFVVATR